jgi:hypothetical protein
MNSIFTVIILSIVLLGLCVAGLAITIIVKKNGRFPEAEIGHNKNMRKLGIRCTKQEELSRWRSNTKQTAGNACSLCEIQCEDGEK